jgi:hypothetical protein
MIKRSPFFAETLTIPSASASLLLPVRCPKVRVSLFKLYFNPLVSIPSTSSTGMSDIGVPATYHFSNVPRAGISSNNHQKAQV